MEIWKYVKGYDGYYQVSDLGRVKSLDRKVKCVGGFYAEKKGKILKKSLAKNGYFVINLCKEKRQSTSYIHKLVACAFLNHIKDGYNLVINHIDRNKENNNLSNLEVITQRENCCKDHIKSSSKYKGVYWEYDRKKWRSRLYVNNKKIHIGRFDSEKEASEEYKKALKLHNIE